MSVTVIEKHNSTKRSNSIIAVRPYVDNSVTNMGLEKYNMSLFEGVVHEEQLACLENNGTKRYITGLNEFAPDIKTLSEDEKKAKIKEIRRIVVELERDLASNVIDPDDKDFWSKVQLCSPGNHAFWDKIIIRCGNEPVFLDPKSDPYDLIKLKAIEAGGFSIIAKSYEEAKKRSVPPKFYLDKFEETAVIKTEVKKLRNKALSALQDLYDTNTNKLFYVCKVIDANSTQYRKTTSHDVMYDNMDKYINGETVDKDKRKTASRFLEIVGLDMETLTIRSLVKDGTFYKAIATKSDGYIYHIKSNSMLGKNPTEVVEYLKNPLHEDVLADITRICESQWNG